MNGVYQGIKTINANRMMSTGEATIAGENDKKMLQEKGNNQLNI